MTDRRSEDQLMRFLCHYLSIILMLSVGDAHSFNCRNRLDIAVAVDTTSSKTAADFDQVRTEVKKVVSNFTVLQVATRLALVSIARQAHVVVNFKGVNSVSDFNAAVDRLAFSADTADLSEGIKVAREQVLSTARANLISKLLILVKDRRNVAASVSGAAVLSLVASEASAVTSSGVAIHAVGIGGLWAGQELQALYGTEYLLFKNQNKALESARSLNNTVCGADCPLEGTSAALPAVCYGSRKHVINTKVDIILVNGLAVCRQEISRHFEACSANDRCFKRDRHVGPCGSNSQAVIVNTWQNYDYKLQTCKPASASVSVPCADKDRCTDQVADVIFILDRSGSIGIDFPFIKNATYALIQPLQIGADKVRVGILTFSSDAQFEINLGQHNDRDSLLAAVSGLSTSVGGGTHTHKALNLAGQTFSSQGRLNAPKYVFVMTDGGSNYPLDTIAAGRALKDKGVTIFAIGVGKVNRNELKQLAEPESDKNTIILSGMSSLNTWAAQFSKSMCVEVTAPMPVFCEDKVFVQSVSECRDGKTEVMTTAYTYNAASNCIKSFQSIELQSCKSKCIDPVDGNEYVEVTTWSTVCHQFRCDAGSNVPVETGSHCMKADGSCVAIGSSPFTCRDVNNVEKSNCACVDRGGKPTVVIDTT